MVAMIDSLVPLHSAVFRSELFFQSFFGLQFASVFYLLFTLRL